MMLKVKGYDDWFGPLDWLMSAYIALISITPGTSDMRHDHNCDDGDDDGDDNTCFLA